MADIDDVEEEVGLAHLVERALEGIDEVGGQLADEAHGVAEQEGQVINDDLADGRVEGGEEFVLGKHLTLGEQVHQGTLADVGVADERHAYHLAAIAALGGLLLVDFREALLEEAHAVQDDAAVHLELCLARSSQSYRAFAAAAARAAALSLEVRPEALQARQHVAILCQLDLRLGIGRLCAHGEDVEDERRAVEYLYLELVLDVA